MNLVILGAPGSGKGTQAARLAVRLAVPHLSTGDMLRAAVRDGTLLGRKAEKFMKAGELVPDDVIVGLIGEKQSSGDLDRGFVMDGFPRTVPQAEALDRLLEATGGGINRAVLLQVDEAEIIRRLSSRLYCRTCQAGFGQTANQPRMSGTCDRCGTILESRPDDSLEVIHNRLRVYKLQSLPVEAYYRTRSILLAITGVGTPDEIFARVIAGLNVKVDA